MRQRPRRASSRAALFPIGSHRNDAWEIKHDGWVIARKDGPRVKALQRPGNDLTRRASH
jgi:hypothetical protein